MLAGPVCFAGARVGSTIVFGRILSWHRAKLCVKPCCSVSSPLRLSNEQVLIRGIADQVATRLTRHGASAFTADGLGMICWAYSELKVRRCLSIYHHCRGSAGQACACWA